MFVHCGLLLLFLNCVRTTEYIHSNGLDDRVAEFNKRFSWWPSVHNAASLVRVRRQIKQAPDVLETEGGSEKSKMEAPASNTTIPAAGDVTNVTKANTTPKATTPAPQVTVSTVSTVAPVATSNETKTTNTTSATEKPKELDLNNPGVLKRGFIVFGGFALLAIAYFIFYRKKSKNNDPNKTNNTNDANQFRYGVLESEDRRDNLELSRVPLTMESDDEDEDLEIFDLEQKKKSLSYVNLQTNDEEVVFSHRSPSDTDRDNLLLDIEDGNSDTLINWSSSGSKSIL